MLKIFMIILIGFFIGMLFAARIFLEPVIAVIWVRINTDKRFEEYMEKHLTFSMFEILAFYGEKWSHKWLKI